MPFKTSSVIFAVFVNVNLCTNPFLTERVAVENLMIELTALNPETFPKYDSLVLELYYRDIPFVISDEQTPFFIGRTNSESGLPVNGEFASRKHCVIEFKQGKFILRDFSRNGTFVQLSSAQTFRLQNEATPLIGSGSFKLGAELSIDDPERILFKVKAHSKKS
jgi:FHA domain